ncbi:putative ankyrin-repeat protein [Fowlpox virus isolate HP-438/Munich]|uniref:Putative ankyrin-repeat protein n=1 Tax=Fowlpox virus TaxID=10261 RepID=Q70HD6_FOWPV|nr:putative ankyrin-repeat protein [Fowlpox virus isolate HP-438/Munich]
MEVFEAIESGCVSDVIKALKGNDSDPNMVNEYGCSLLHCAVENGNTEIARILLLEGANPDLYTESTPTALHRAVILRHYDIVNLLMEFNVDPDNYENHESRTPLEYAVKLNDVKMTKTLLDYGADAEDIYRFNCPINDAAANGNLEICKLLIDAGARINSRSMGSVYTIHHAIRSGNYELVVELLSRGALPDVEDELSFSSLHHAVMEGSADMVLTLLEHGASVEVQDFCGRTPLFLAANASELDIVKVLLDFWADTSVSSGRNTPLSVCDLNSDTGIEIAKQIISTMVINTEYKYHKVINEEARRNDLEIIESNNEMKDWKDSCIEEVEKMRKTTLGSDRRSLLDLCLNCDDNAIAKCLNCISCEGFFIYRQLIEYTIERGLLRHESLDKALDVMEKAFEKNRNVKDNGLKDWSDLPLGIKYDILEKIDEEDLPYC